jgi:hypothetical protein
MRRRVVFCASVGIGLRLQAFCKHQASAAVSPCSAEMQAPCPLSGLEPAFRRNTAAHLDPIAAAHNPEVAGSNPAPAIQKAPQTRGFCLGIVSTRGRGSTRFLPRNTLRTIDFRRSRSERPRLGLGRRADRRSSVSGCATSRTLARRCVRRKIGWGALHRLSLRLLLPGHSARIDAQRIDANGRRVLTWSAVPSSVGA